MPVTDRAVDRAIRANRVLLLSEQATELRRCLGCEGWFHSTGPDHRQCNRCKGNFRSVRRGTLVGEPIRSGRRRGHARGALR